MTKWIEKFMDIIKEILLWPPYLIFVFVSSVFVAFSLVSNKNFDKIWIFFIYSIVGSMWRYIEKDMHSGIQKMFKEEKGKNISSLIVISIYHIGNIGLFFALLHYLKFI